MSIDKLREEQQKSVDYVTDMLKLKVGVVEVAAW
jgi:hypothetical protein